MWTEYSNRLVYRRWTGRSDEQLDHFEVTLAESNLLITCEPGLRDEARSSLGKARRELEGFVDTARIGSRFLSALRPVATRGPALPELVSAMSTASWAWNVGPMAAVAGAIAERVARDLSKRSSTVIVENGGDIFACSPGDLSFAVYPGASSPFLPLFRVSAAGGVGVCTSSGTVGHSLSMGVSDAVVAVSASGALADAAATAIANMVDGPGDVERLLELVGGSGGGDLRGLVICCGEMLGIRGDILLTSALPRETEGNQER